MLIHAKVYETNLQRMIYLNNPSIQTFADIKKKKEERKTNKQNKAKKYQIHAVGVVQHVLKITKKDSE